MKQFPTLALLLATLSLSSAQADEAVYPWETSHATVLPNGELEYAPQAFEYIAGDSQRYIDFESGDDANPGTKAAPWKHHPWDPDARANAQAAAEEAHSYVFKGGVTYRGSFTIPSEARGTAENPIRLTRDPAWGSGPAVINGAEVIDRWEQARHPKMPDDQTVWAADVDFLPRTLWLTDHSKAPIRMKLARWPNWEESDPNDLMTEWPTWDQPQWWKQGLNETKIGNNTKHVGIAESLPRPLEDLVGGTVWTEWGIVMGSPYPAEIEAVSEVDQGNRTYQGIAFRGPWTYNALERIITGNRYYIEDLPQLLDEPGEFWVEKKGRGGRIFVRLPGDADPNNFILEAGRQHNFFAGERFEHIHWTGLTFRYGNVRWNYDHPRWMHDQTIAAIKLSGQGDGIVIANNTFEHLPMPIRIEVGSPEQSIGSVSIRDNWMRHTDHGAAYVVNATPRKSDAMGQLGHVDFLRNKLEHIGMRIISGEHGHAVDLRYPETSHMAGNFLHRIAGWGLAVFGGKPSGRGDIDAPLSRHLIHHNRVEDVLLKSNDWGGIETWQGGSHYVYNNIVINAIGFKHWIWNQGKEDRASSFGHAYYMDGSFKNYLFNNIGLGLNNDVATKGVNLTAIQNIISFENWYFNNSFHRFVAATRQQAPDAGRFRYLGNVFSDISQITFRHADPKDGEPDPNAAHFTQGGDFDYPTLAYRNNIFDRIEGNFGVFEETGVTYETLDGFRQSLQRLNAQADSVGTMIEEKPFRAPDEMDWRPTASPAVAAADIRVFVPWAVARPVGEWQFTRNQSDPSEVIDEHWFMTGDYDGRKEYMNTQRYPLIGSDIDASNYGPGPLANWTDSALTLDGRAEYLKLAHASLPGAAVASSPEDKTPEKQDTQLTDITFAQVDHPVHLTPGTPVELTVKLNQPYPGQQLGLHVHWLKSGGWGGFSQVTQPRKLSETEYRIRLTPKAHNGAVSYNLLPFLSPNGNWNERTEHAQINLPQASETPSRKTAPTGPWSVDIDETGLLIETHLKTTDRDGIIVSKVADGVGYALYLAKGHLHFSAASGNGSSASVQLDSSAITNGAWHHLLAEFDRKNGQITLFLNGETAARAEIPSDFSGSLSNPADFLVGGGQNQAHLAASFDYLRVAAATLAESKTSIEELYHWTFDGPQYRDFAGHDRREQNAAGALTR